MKIKDLKNLIKNLDDELDVEINLKNKDVIYCGFEDLIVVCSDLEGVVYICGNNDFELKD